MAKKGTNTGVGVGGSSILVIFILLCLTTFATLSMVSANADLRLTEKTVTAVGEYYVADAQAEEMLEQVDSVLWASIANRRTGEAFIQNAMTEIPQLVPAATVERETDDTLLVRYRVPVNESQELSVALRVMPDDFSALSDTELNAYMADSSSRFVREEWLVVSIGEWEPESGGFNVWGGDEDALFLGDGLPFEE